MGTDPVLDKGQKGGGRKVGGQKGVRNRFCLVFRQATYITKPREQLRQDLGIVRHAA